MAILYCFVSLNVSAWQTVWYKTSPASFSHSKQYLFVNAFKDHAFIVYKQKQEKKKHNRVPLKLSLSCMLEWGQTQSSSLHALIIIRFLFQPMKRE